MASKGTVLVTGASGFVAAHVMNEFLDNGYHVVGTVRSEASAGNVRETHGKYGDKLSFAIVKDITEPGAFDEAVKGVDGVSTRQRVGLSPKSKSKLGHSYRLSFCAPSGRL